MNDPISNFLTTIRNAYRASHASCVTPYSKMHEGLSRILKEEGYILDYKTAEVRKGVRELTLQLKYVDDTPAVLNVARVSKPGLRVYASYNEFPKVLNGLGINIISTPKGVLSDRQARKQKLGGEIICKVW